MLGLPPRDLGEDALPEAFQLRLALAFPLPGLDRVALAEPPVRRIVAARLAASYRSAATASMLGVLQQAKMW